MLKLQINKWYILHKPSKNHEPWGGGKIIWESFMDKYDGKIVQCKEIFGLRPVTGPEAATFQGIHSFQFHYKWTEGPFEAKEDAIRNQIKIDLKQKNLGVREFQPHSAVRPHWGQNNVVKFKVKDLDRKYDREIDNVFGAYHQRNNQKIKLDERMAREFAKNNPRKGWKRLLLLGSGVTALTLGCVLWFNAPAIIDIFSKF